MSQTLQMPDESSPLIEQISQRALSDRHAAYEAEVRHLIEAAYRVSADSGDFASPTIRAILAEAGLSNPAFYRHFRSKDELLLVMLDEGRRKLVSYLDHRVGRVDDEARVGEWIRGVLAQAVDPEAARRTRPFFTEVAMLTRSFPDEQRASEEQLIEQLARLLGDTEELAAVTYQFVFAALGRFILSDTTPTDHDVETIVRFVDAGVRSHEARDD